MASPSYTAARAAALGDEEEAIAHWQIKRDGNKRGILEVIERD